MLLYLFRPILDMVQIILHLKSNEMEILEHMRVDGRGVQVRLHYNSTREKAQHIIWLYNVERRNA